MKTRNFDRKLPIGTLVVDSDGNEGTIIKHGRNTGGIYTEVEYLEGDTIQWHRSHLRLPSEGYRDDEGNWNLYDPYRYQNIR